jgi:hypothetical protein
VCEAGFTEIEREFVSKGVGSEVIMARRPAWSPTAKNIQLSDRKA